MQEPATRGEPWTTPMSPDITFGPWHQFSCNILNSYHAVSAAVQHWLARVPPANTT